MWRREGWSWPDLNGSRQSLLYSRSFSNTPLWDTHALLCVTLCVCHAAARALPSWHCWTFLPSPWRGSNWGKSCWNSMLLYSVPFVDGRLFVTNPSTVHPINMTPKITLVLLPLKARWAKKLGLVLLVGSVVDSLEQRILRQRSFIRSERHGMSRIGSLEHCFATCVGAIAQAWPQVYTPLWWRPLTPT